jgi:hypothetical protein
MERLVRAICFGIFSTAILVVVAKAIEFHMTGLQVLSLFVLTVLMDLLPPEPK